MHRDLKPENFLLTSKEAHGEIKLTDFGLGVFFKPGQKFTDLVGSPYYVAPEVRAHALLAWEWGGGGSRGFDDRPRGDKCDVCLTLSQAWLAT